MELLQQLVRYLQQFQLHFLLVGLDVFRNSADPPRVDVSSAVGDKQDFLQFYFPVGDAGVVEEKRAIDLEPVFEEADDAGAPVPARHVLDGQVIPEKVVFAQPREEVVLVDEFVEGSELALAHHAVFADGDVVPALFLLAAGLELVDAGDAHVEELFALGLLEHGDYFGDGEYLVLEQVCDGVVDGLPALHLYGRQHLYRLYPLPHLPQVYYLLRLLLRPPRPAPALQRRQTQLRDRPVARGLLQAALLDVGVELGHEGELFC